MGDAASNGSVQKVENNRFARADLERRLLMLSLIHIYRAETVHLLPDKLKTTSSDNDLTALVRVTAHQKSSLDVYKRQA